MRQSKNFECCRHEYTKLTERKLKGKRENEMFHTIDWRKKDYWENPVYDLLSFVFVARTRKYINWKNT